VFHELDATDPSKPYTVGPGNFVHDLIVLAGGENVFADAPTPFPQVGFEEVLVRDPEVIILADAPFGTTVEAVKARIGWDVIDAVANDRMLAVSQDLSDQISRPGPRIAKGLEAFARFLHPELFE
jgi:iron complex transport system substrate-binding protein